VQNTVTQEQIDHILSKSTFVSQQISPTMTLVHCTLPNGFQLAEHSACVDPANYDHSLGYELAKKKIIDKLWQLEGYLLAENRHRESQPQANLSLDELKEMVRRLKSAEYGFTPLDYPIPNFFDMDEEDDDEGDYAITIHVRKDR